MLLHMAQVLEIMPPGGYPAYAARGMLHLLEQVALEDEHTRVIATAAAVTLTAPVFMIPNTNGVGRRQVTSDRDGQRDPAGRITMYRTVLEYPEGSVEGDLLLYDSGANACGMFSDEIPPQNRPVHDIPTNESRPDVFGIRLLDNKTRRHVAGLVRRLSVIEDQAT